MQLLIDAQLPPALAEALRSKSFQTTHVEEIDLRHAKDSALWDYALKNQAIILTKDEDFVERFRRHPQSAIIVWLRIGNATNLVLLKWFLPLLPQVIQRIKAGDKLIEVR